MKAPAPEWMRQTLEALRLPEGTRVSEQLRPACLHQRLAKGTLLFSPHDAADSLFVILKGSVRVARADRERVVSAGEVLGEHAAVLGWKRGSLAVAIERTEVVEVPAALLLRVAEQAGNSH